jgi:AbrB family looped-hinge helix DNA binding protein
METAKISGTGQTTIPASIREFLKIKKGDRLLFEVNDNKNVILRKIKPFDAEFALSLESTLSNEWNSDSDSEAYNDL